jgi:transcriptional regulator with XRE-family HTH domain
MFEHFYTACYNGQRLMNLKEYLEKKKISQREFAKKLRISNSTVAAISRGKRPSKKTAAIIEAYTDGKVKASMLLQQEPWKRIALYR